MRHREKQASCGTAQVERGAHDARRRASPTSRDVRGKSEEVTVDKKAKNPKKPKATKPKAIG
jgi:hypothetical protein